MQLAKQKPSTKQTDVGVIPADWELKPLGSLADVTAGGTPSRGIPAYWDGGIPWVTTTVVNFGRIKSTEQHISALGLKNSAAKLLNPGTILLALYGQGKTRGKVAVLDIEATSNQACAAIVLTAKVSQPFVFSYLASRYDFIRGLSNTGNQENLNGVIVKSIPIPLPPTLAEQEAIAAALSDANGLIESLEKLIAKKRQIKHGTMQELLTGKRRLPGFSGKWETKRLGEIGEAVIGLTYKPSDVRESGVLVLRASNIVDGLLCYEDNVFVEMDVPERVFVRQGDILICVRNGSRDLIGKCAKINESARGMVFGAFMSVYRTLYHDFIHYQFLSDGMKRQIHEHLGATINQITNKSLNSFQVPFPLDENEQTAIAAILSDMDAEIATLEAKLTKARHVKQGMMQELLTGRTRLI